MRYHMIVRKQGLHSCFETLILGHNNVFRGNHMRQAVLLTVVS